MIEVLKLALKVIADVLDVVHQAESGLVTPEQARSRLQDFHDRIQAGDNAADAAVDKKFGED
jgi:hypothetical protein